MKTKLSNDEYVRTHASKTLAENNTEHQDFLASILRKSEMKNEMTVILSKGIVGAARLKSPLVEPFNKMDLLAPGQARVGDMQMFVVAKADVGPSKDLFQNFVFHTARSIEAITVASENMARQLVQDCGAGTAEQLTEEMLDATTDPCKVKDWILLTGTFGMRRLARLYGMKYEGVDFTVNTAKGKTFRAHALHDNDGCHFNILPRQSIAVALDCTVSYEHWEKKHAQIMHVSRLTCHYNKSLISKAKSIRLYTPKSE